MLCFEDEGLLNGSLAYVDFSLFRIPDCLMRKNDGYGLSQRRRLSLEMLSMVRGRHRMV